MGTKGMRAWGTMGELTGLLSGQTAPPQHEQVYTKRPGRPNGPAPGIDPKAIYHEGASHKGNDGGTSQGIGDVPELGLGGMKLLLNVNVNFSSDLRKLGLLIA